MWLTLDIPSSPTGRVDFFAAPLLGSNRWNLLASDVPTLGNSQMLWRCDVGDAAFIALGNANVDADGDGLPDAREQFVTGTRPDRGDSDQDGASDAEELAAGTDPLDHASVAVPGRGILIDEFCYYTNAPSQWIELFNTNRFDIDLAGLVAEAGLSNLQTVCAFTPGTVIAAGGFLLVGGTNVAGRNVTANMGLPNPSGAPGPALLRIASPGLLATQVVDACIYGTSVTAAVFSQAGFGGHGPFSNPAPVSAAGLSVARVHTGYDDDAGCVEWYATTASNPPTPTAAGQLMDLDGDGLSNIVELTGSANPFGGATDMSRADTDGDGLSDGAEVLGAVKTDPNNIDTDGDMWPWPTNGVYIGSDGDEINRMTTDPRVRDGDGDGIPDGWESAMGLNPKLADSNTNGTPDGAEDTDADGLKNTQEVAQLSNPYDAKMTNANAWLLLPYHLPKAGWTNGAPLGHRGWIGYAFASTSAAQHVDAAFAEGGAVTELYSATGGVSVVWNETGGRTNLVWGDIDTNAAPRLIVRDGGTWWTNPLASTAGADIRIFAPGVDLQGYQAYRGADTNMVPEAEEVDPGLLVTPNSDPSTNNPLEAKIVAKAVPFATNVTRWLRFSDASKVQLWRNGWTNPITPTAEYAVTGAPNADIDFEVHMSGTWPLGTTVNIDVLLRDAAGYTVGTGDTVRLLAPVVMSVGDSMTFGLRRLSDGTRQSPTYGNPWPAYPDATAWAAYPSSDRFNVDFQGYRGHLGNAYPGFVWTGVDSLGHGPFHMGYSGAYSTDINSMLGTTNRLYPRSAFLGSNCYAIIVYWIGYNDIIGSGGQNGYSGVLYNNFKTGVNQMLALRAGRGRNLLIGVALPQFGSGYNVNTLQRSSVVNYNSYLRSHVQTNVFTKYICADLESVAHDSNDDSLHFLAPGYSNCATRIKSALFNGLK